MRLVIIAGADGVPFFRHYEDDEKFKDYTLRQGADIEIDVDLHSQDLFIVDTPSDNEYDGYIDVRC